MDRDDMAELEARLMEEVVKRRKLGGYSVEAAGVLMLSESMLAIVQHLKDAMPRKK